MPLLLAILSAAWAGTPPPPPRIQRLSNYVGWASCIRNILLMSLSKYQSAYEVR